MACGREGSGMVPKMWDTSLWERVWPYLDPWESVRLRTASTHWNVPKNYGPHGEFFFFFLKNEPLVLSELVEFRPSISAETVKACAMIGLHMRAEEHALWSDMDFSPDLGEMWKLGAAMALQRKEVRVRHPWSIIEVVGQNWSSEVISLFLEDEEVGRMALSCHLSIDLLCQEMRDVRKGSPRSLESPRSL